MRWVYREVNGRVQSFPVSKIRRNNPEYDKYGDHIPFHRRILNAYGELEQKGELFGPMRNNPNKSYVRDVHVQALEEGF